MMFFGGMLSLRRRSVWEAADAGLLIWRKNFAYFIPFFAIPFWICAFVLWSLPDLLETVSRSLLPWLILWWLNPLFDRLILHVVGVRFFEPGAGLRRLCRGLGKSIFRGLVGDLLWRRFSPWRAAVLPLRVLEPAAGITTGKTKKKHPLRERKRALANGGLHFSLLLTAWCFTLQWVILLGEALFVLMIARLFFDVSIWGMNQIFTGKGIYYFAAWCVNYLVIESLYVCMGFGLYLNSRVDVEGWDLELMFRNFANRRKNATAVMLAIVFSLGLLFPPGVRAEESESPPPLVSGGLTSGALLPPELGADIPEEELEKIIGRDMGSEKKTWGIRLKNQRDEDSDPLFPHFSAPWIAFFQKAGAFILRAILVMAIAALAVFCGVYVYRHRGSLGVPPAASTLSAAPPPAPSSPEQLLEEAGRLYSQGLIREAWGRCYAAALGALAVYRGVRFPPGATEYRCLALLRSQAGGRELGGPFAAGLIRHWVALAYGGSNPPEGAFEEAVAWVNGLCVPAGNAEGESHD
jgi:hypothetical protein